MLNFFKTMRVPGDFNNTAECPSQTQRVRRLILYCPSEPSASIKLLTIAIGDFHLMPSVVGFGRAPAGMALTPCGGCVRPREEEPKEHEDSAMYVMPILLVPFFVWSWWLDAAVGALTDAERVTARSVPRGG
jgi:hypothetical protein